MVNVIYGRLPSGSGYGYGSGSYGYGDGDGYGSGSGSGDGDGSYGSGYSSGSGDGDGSGSYGYGDGSYGSGLYGYGYGYGSGSGYGSGDLKYAVDGFVSLLVAEKRERVKYLRRNKAIIAYWKSDSDGRACNGGSGESVRVGLIEKSEGPLVLCKKGVLHATYKPQDWNGDRIWLVALTGKVIEQDGKLGALQREFIAEITPGKEIQ